MLTVVTVLALAALGASCLAAYAVAYAVDTADRAYDIALDAKRDADKALVLANKAGGLAEYAHTKLARE